MPKPKCLHCKRGHKPASDGYHYIVKSVFPARMTIKLCADYVPAGDDKPTAPGGMLDSSPAA